MFGWKDENKWKRGSGWPIKKSHLVPPLLLALIFWYICLFLNQVQKSFEEHYFNWAKFTSCKKKIDSKFYLQFFAFKKLSLSLQ